MQLTPDFITQTTINKFKEEFAAKPSELGAKARFFEEINLLYVALTRARARVYVPAGCLPTGFQPHADVRPMQGSGGTVLLQKLKPVVAIPMPRVEWKAYDPAPAPIDPRFASLQQKLDASSLNPSTGST